MFRLNCAHFLAEVTWQEAIAHHVRTLAAADIAVDSKAIRMAQALALELEEASATIKAALELEEASATIKAALELEDSAVQIGE
jgi:hypothetical protein